LDLVLETQISIERAERVFEFWRCSEPSARSAGGATRSAQTSPPIEVHPTSLPTSRERRGEERLSRDSLIRSLCDPDPCVRERAFLRLKEL
jgi:hypothetical protein